TFCPYVYSTMQKNNKTIKYFTLTFMFIFLILTIIKTTLLSSCSFLFQNTISGYLAAINLGGQSNSAATA
ncbi:MAG: hypothetical protein IKJ67_04485, partial [Bacteroidales bacterium]|nr:hypothetical protein [Bacteroidales bacterium]